MVAASCQFDTAGLSLASARGEPDSVLCGIVARLARMDTPPLTAWLGGC